MTQNEITRLALLEKDISYIKLTTSRIEKALTDHVNWENDKYDEMGVRFARKEVENEIKFLDNKITDMPDKLTKKFAGIWTEAWLRAVIFTIGGSIFVGLFFHLMQK